MSERSAASVWDDAARRWSCHFKWGMGNFIFLPGTRTAQRSTILLIVVSTRARQTYHVSVRVGLTFDPDFPILEHKTFPQICGTYSAKVGFGSQCRPDQLFQYYFNSISTPDPSCLARAHPGVPDGILVAFIMVFKYSAGTGSLVS